MGSSSDLGIFTDIPLRNFEYQMPKSGYNIYFIKLR